MLGHISSSASRADAGLARACVPLHSPPAAHLASRLARRADGAAAGECLRRLGATASLQQLGWPDSRHGTAQQAGLPGRRGRALRGHADPHTCM